MNIENKIRSLEDRLVFLRKQWKSASQPMKMLIEKEAKNINGQIMVFNSVLRRRKGKTEGQLEI